MSGTGWNGTPPLVVVPDRIRGRPFGGGFWSGQNGWMTTMRTYVIAHVTGTSYLGKSGWTSKAFARRFDTYEEALDFLLECKLELEGAEVEAV